jgi:hypothetical protein
LVGRWAKAELDVRVALDTRHTRVGEHGGLAAAVICSWT